MATGILQKNMVLLWTNSNPSSTFAEQKISISTILNYDFVLVAFYQQTVSALIPTFDNFTGYVMSPSLKNYPNYRQITVVEDGLEFSNAYLNSETVNTSILIPIRIYGIKA